MKYCKWRLFARLDATAVTKCCCHTFIRVPFRVRLFGTCPPHDIRSAATVCLRVYTRRCRRSVMMQRGATRRFCCNERWTYHMGRRAPNKSPDPPVTQVDISFVPLHFLYQRAFLQMSQGWKISQPITVHCCPRRQHQGEFALGGSYRNDSRGWGGGTSTSPP